MRHLPSLLALSLLLAVSACGDNSAPLAGDASVPLGDLSPAEIDAQPGDDAALPVGGDGSSADFSALTRHMDENLDDFLGKVYVAFMRDGELLFEYSAGGADENTVFPMASASKWISAGVILRLAEQGHFGLHDRVGDHLPIFDTYDKGDFTIRQAFGMSSGLFDASRPHTNRTLTLEESVNAIAANTKVLFDPPGSSIAYDGKQMQVVGRIAEVTTQVDWRKLAHETLFAPCGMEHTHYDVFGTNPAVAGGISTTAKDYLAYLHMLQNGGRCGDVQVLKAESIAIMFDNYTDDAPVLETPWPSNHPLFPYGKDDLRYGFGSWLLAEDPTTGEVEELTSPGAWGSFPWLDKKRGVYGVILTEVPLADGGFQAVLDADLELLSLLRSALDARDAK